VFLETADGQALQAAGHAAQLGTGTGGVVMGTVASIAGLTVGNHHFSNVAIGLTTTSAFSRRASPTALSASRSGKAEPSLSTTLAAPCVSTCRGEPAPHSAADVREARPERECIFLWVSTPASE
jgi:hypothetical protein